jgi:hypothetical protein
MPMGTSDSLEFLINKLKESKNNSEFFSLPNRVEPLCITANEGARLPLRVIIRMASDPSYVRFRRQRTKPRLPRASGQSRFARPDTAALVKLR